VSAVTGIAALAVDSNDPVRLAAFWQRLLGGAVSVDDDGDASLEGPAVRMDFLRVPERASVKNRLHLDLHSSDFEAAVREALAAGATRADDVYAGGRWQVLRDPEGNEFCILRPT
jgi:uncharacterized glyoxalase superfamily protein PhnB